MMRSMFSGVVGLKTHQMKMDVIGNNIANVNTTAYKSSSINFSELLYQTQSFASGPNGTTGRAGVNPKQIGLGVQSAAITNAITTGGATQNTGNPFDIKINGDAFFVVSGGSGYNFTRDGSFYVDAAGNLAMSATGYNVMGWGIDQQTGTIKKDTVQALRIMSTANMEYPPEATTEAYVSGILDRNEPDATTSAGKTLAMRFYDSLGYSYMAKFSIKETNVKGEYTVELADIMNSEGESLVDVYNVNSIDEIAGFGGTNYTTPTTVMRDPITGVTYDSATGTYTKALGPEDVLSNYSSTKLSGITYTYQANQGDVKAGDTVTMDGSGKVSKSDLETTNGLIFVGADDPANTQNPKEDYYLLPAKDGKPEMRLTAGSSTADWEAALGITGITSVNMDDDGVSFELTQDFTAGRDAAFLNGMFTSEISQEEAYGLDPNDTKTQYTIEVAENGRARITSRTEYKGYILKFNVDTGKFDNIGGGNSVTLDFNGSVTTKLGTTESLGSFSDINVDWRTVTWFDNGGASTISSTPGTSGEDGSTKGLGAGRAAGKMSGISIQNNGEIYCTYDNGMSKLVGQIAVAKFANAAGLEKVGDNLYAATLNSGDFDGVGVDITADGEGSMTTGALEMSNVDLSSEFTHMITTQRGFQANSRIITVSDTLLEELVNLKR